MENEKIILSAERFDLMTERLCYQLIERYEPTDNVCLIGIQPRGTLFAQCIKERMAQLDPTFKFDFGILDITFYRDDFRRHDEPLQPNSTQIDFVMEDRPVVLVDDVLYTGRTIQAAMTAIQDFGRPSTLELMVLVNRRFNRHLPIQADYVGVVVDALDEAYVRVFWEDQDGGNKVVMYSSKSAN